MAKELLKEAIADAKAVREVALQNAKMALEEAFDSKIKNMLSARLAEELDEDVELEEEYVEEEEVEEDEIDLDEIGSFIWGEINKSNSVENIVELTKQHFGEKVEPAENRVVQFMKQMHSTKLIMLYEKQGID